MIRSYLKALLVSAGVPNADDFARKWHVLMKGSIMAAAEEDLDAAIRAQEIGALLLPASVLMESSASAYQPLFLSL